MSTENLSTQDSNLTIEKPTAATLLQECEFLSGQIAKRTKGLVRGVLPVEDLLKRSQLLEDIFHATPKGEMGSNFLKIHANVSRILGYCKDSISSRKTIDVIPESENEAFGLPHQPQESLID